MRKTTGSHADDPGERAISYASRPSPPRTRAAADTYHADTTATAPRPAASSALPYRVPPRNAPSPHGSGRRSNNTVARPSTTSNSGESCMVQLDPQLRTKTHTHLELSRAGRDSISGALVSKRRPRPLGRRQGRVLPRPVGSECLHARSGGRYPDPETGMDPVHLGHVFL
jgi:hypothetical protein